MTTKKGQPRLPFRSPAKETSCLAQDDFDAAVLRLAHTHRRRDERTVETEALDGDFVAGNATANQLGGHRFGAADGQALVVGGSAGAVGVAGHLDAGRAHGGRSSPLRR